MSTNFRSVKEFNVVFGHPAPETTQKYIFQDSPKTVKLRNNLINEEFSELTEAFTNNDIVEMVDALADILYVAYGLLVVYGEDGDAYFRKHIQKKVLTHNQQGDESISINTDPNVSNFQIVNGFCYNFFSVLIDSETCFPSTFFSNESIKRLQVFNTFMIELETELVQLASASDSASYDDVIKSTSQIIYLTYVCGLLLGVDLDKAVDLVHKSNMSKLCSSEDEAKSTVEWYKQNESRYDSPNYKQSSKGFIIYNESSGKILKNINYNPVDLSGLVSLDKQDM